MDPPEPPKEIPEPTSPDSPPSEPQETPNEYTPSNISSISQSSIPEMEELSTTSNNHVPKETPPRPKTSRTSPKSDKPTNGKAGDTQTMTTERIVPVIDVKSTVKDKAKAVPSLRRTSSEHMPFNIARKNSAMYGSQETLPTKTDPKDSKERKPPSAGFLRRNSMDKPATPVRGAMARKPPPGAGKTEKGITTETRTLTSSEPKSNALRKLLTKPRSQIVADVTQRLYAKTRIKEVGTNTDNIKPEAKASSRELEICSNARLRLKELTRRALRAHRIRDASAQTDLVPVLRVKEMSTDVNDLKESSREVKSVSTLTQQTTNKDSSTNCSYLESFAEEGQCNGFGAALLVTRSCGTQVEEADKECPMKQCCSFEELRLPPNMSRFFNQRNHRLDQNQPIAPEASPIYANTININISGSFVNEDENVRGASCDSLESGVQQNTVSQPPDLISNHNSLEPHMQFENAQSAIVQPVVKFATSESVQEKYYIVDSLPPSAPNYSPRAFFVLIPNYCEKVPSIGIPVTTHVPEVYTSGTKEERCAPLPIFNPQTARPKTTECTVFKCDDVINIQEPVLLKSIMKQIADQPKAVLHEKETQTNIENANVESKPRLATEDIPDSLEYHMSNSKKVHFRHNDQVDRKLMEVMSNFLEEATTFITNFAERKTDPSPRQCSEEFDLQVTVNDVFSTFPACRKHKRRRCRHESRKTLESEGTQTEASTDRCPTPIERAADDYPKPTSLQVPGENYAQPVVAPLNSDPGCENKYDALLQDSCRRLEEKLNCEPAITPELRVQSVSDLNLEDNGQLNFDYNPWELNASNYNDFSSLESNQVFSDYGSLPRKHAKRLRTSCSPSAFLRQLTNMRKQVVESAREELLAENVPK